MARPAYLAAERETLAGHVGARDPRLIVLEHGKVVGSFSASQSSDDASLGPRAGLDLIFHPSIQGRGAVKTAYRLLLESLRARGVTTFFGGTSQPAILGLARVLGRRLYRLILRPGAFLGEAHFGDWV